MSAALVGLFSACQSENDIDNNVEGDEETTPIVMNFSEKTDKDNAFTFDLFRITYAHSKESNVFISPLSISLAFNMVLNGSEGKTKADILEALRAKGYSVEDINEYTQALCTDIASPGYDELTEGIYTDLKIANSIWAHNNWGKYPLKKEFIEINQAYYDAEVNEIDFDAPDALSRINGWCAEKTNYKIENVIEEISSASLLYIINAVYFKGHWFHPFMSELTGSEKFYPEDGGDKEVDMMKATHYYEYFEDNLCQYLELSYRNRNFGMILMLPQQGKTTEDVIQHMDNDRWLSVKDGFEYKNVYLELPKFKFECKYEMQKGILQDMGMKAPFDSKIADFSGISNMPQLFISKVIHNTFVEVNEEGTEAAAITVIEFPTGESGIEPPKPIDYIVNKPFLFGIREKTTGAILFFGKVGDINGE